MKFVIVVSRKDPAGMNIASFLSDTNLEVIYFENDSIYADNIDKIEKAKDADFIIFASEHQGTKEKMLTLHAPGNWSKADFGGKKGEICNTFGNVLKIFFQQLNRNLPRGWGLTLECTHHGPYLEKPCLYIEIGSKKENWIDKEAGKAIANTIKEAIEKVNKNKKKYEVGIGLGGPHYCPNFNNIQLNSRYAISHIIPDYIKPITKKMVEEAIAKTQEKVKLAIVDWKGLGKSGERQKVLDILEELGLEIKRTGKIEK